MKAYLFIETGEVRAPKVGEWCLDEFREMSYCDDAETEENFKHEFHPILARHEIPVPDGAEVFVYHMADHYGRLKESTTIPIPIPRKKKVKKYRWWSMIKGTKVNTADHFSDVEMNEKGMQWHKMGETEIEVEE